MRSIRSQIRLIWERRSAFLLVLLSFPLFSLHAQAIGLPIVQSYHLTVTPQVRASSPGGPIDDLLNPMTESPGTQSISSVFTSEGYNAGPPAFNSWSGDVLLRRVGQVSTGTSVSSGTTHRFELDDIQIELNDSQFVRSPIDNITLADWTVAGTYHVTGTYYFGASAMPFDLTGAATAIADHTNTSTLKQIRYLAALVVALPTFSSGGVSYTPRIGLSGETVVVPEPTTALLFGIGLVVLASRRRRAP